MLHVSQAEYQRRETALAHALAADGLDAILLFRQESLYWLTGYDTFGYVYFQCLYVTASGARALLTRAPDRLQARFTSTIEDIRIWVDGPDAAPASELRAMLAEAGLQGARIGVEWDAYGLTALAGQRLTAALDGFATLADASRLISRLRLIKSPEEQAFAREAARLADRSLDAAIAATKPGAFEGDILADMQAAVFREGGDDPANETIIGSGPGALMCRYYTGRRHLDANDQLTLEFAGVWRHYHACLMRTLLIGTPDPRLVAMHAACRDALLATEAALIPGRPLGEAFDAHARVLDAAGLEHARMNACGYSLGATYAPNWMDWPMLYHANPIEAAEGMVIFVHIIAFDAAQGLAMTLGRTSLLGPGGAEPLSKAPLDLILR